ncbi:hypothetical protein GCM10010342_71590 [Streptomyces anulatus]|nr:hypothetical protein GCM10010342_71590 [Streptomyces anulatus]
MRGHPGGHDRGPGGGTGEAHPLLEPLEVAPSLVVEPGAPPPPTPTRTSAVSYGSLMLPAPGSSDTYTEPGSDELLTASERRGREWPAWSAAGSMPSGSAPGNCAE